MNILLQDINSFNINEKTFNENDFIKILSTEELLKIQNIKNFNRKMQFIIGRITLRKYLSTIFLKTPNDINISIKENGAITINESPKIYVSLTHSQNLVCAVINDSPIGVDIEYHKDRKDFLKLANFSFSKEIISSLLLKNEEEQKQIFYDEWTKKEALFKLKSSIDEKADLNTSPIFKTSFLSNKNFSSTIAYLK